MQSVIVGSGERLIITHKQTLVVVSGDTKFLLHDVFLVPELKKNLISIQKLVSGMI